MSQPSDSNNSNLIMKQSQYKISSNRSQLIDLNEVQIPPQKHLNIKYTSICSKIMNSKLIKQTIRFLIYSLIAILLFTYLTKNQSATIYSISSKNLNKQGITLNKQVPGIFPPLSSEWQLILSKWDIVLVSGKFGSKSYKQDHYQLQFKHNEKKQNILYITKNTCDGHIIMNWELYQHNIYLTPFLPPKGSMTIPNLPKDQQCIKQKADMINLLQFTTIWTVIQENSKKSLFLLIEQNKNTNQKNNFVLIADQHKKI